MANGAEVEEEQDPRLEGLDSVMFEKLTAAVHRLVDEGAAVTHDEKRIGVLSGVERQVDVGVRRSGAGLHVLECKHWRKLIGVPQIDAFVGFLQDVRPEDGGTLVSVRGFTETALPYAHAVGIRTMIFRPATDDDWDDSGFLRGFSVQINIIGPPTFHEARATLEDGRVEPLSKVEDLEFGERDDPATFDGIMMDAVEKFGVNAEGQRVSLAMLEPLYLLANDGKTRDRVVGLSAIVEPPGSPFTQLREKLARCDWVLKVCEPGEVERDAEFVDLATLRKLVTSEFS